MNDDVAVALLLPPSEGKAPGGRGRWDPASGAARWRLLAERRERVARALAAAGGGDERLLGVGGGHLARAQSSNSSLLGAPVRRAGERYTGVVWDHLALASLDDDARRRAHRSIVVVSALLGVVGVDDPVPDYRLKMGASLSPLGRMATWWRPAVSDAINGWARRRFVVDLLPNEHRAAWVPEGVRGVSVTFVERDGKVAGHDAKAAKGRLARHVLATGGHPLGALERWQDARFDVFLHDL
ncbi:MAG: peroxide stress protein YaaA [Acidimicrobiales bacterium]|nr:peroxide stress protein YaaA [Acidimicrobiales bacterium]MCB9393508.1 peroxide stress protein YaaA [Acidimicrobiaceae bacterium]